MLIKKFELRADDYGSVLKQNLLLDALKIVFADNRTATHYLERKPSFNSIDPPLSKSIDRLKEKQFLVPPRLTLFSHERDSSELKFPFIVPTTPEMVEPLIRGWLGRVEYGRQPDHDGDNEKGWYCYQQDPKEYDPSVICHIEPAWIEYGK